MTYETELFKGFKIKNFLSKPLDGSLGQILSLLKFQMAVSSYGLFNPLDYWLTVYYSFHKIILPDFRSLFSCLTASFSFFKASIISNNPLTSWF